MRPVQELPVTAAQQVRFVLCDIDDTLTDNGRLSASAYAALEQLRGASYKVIPSTMSKTLLEEIFHYDMTAKPELSLFVGDSPNDCPMFESVGYSIGVANVQEFADQLAPCPQWIAQNRGGKGFAEIAGQLVAARRSVES